MKNLLLNSEIPLETVKLPWLESAQLKLDVLRLDQLHPIISGNKWYKLIGYLDYANTLNLHTLVSCGGAHSNHLHALGYISHQLSLNCWVWIRQSSHSSAMINDLKKWGTHIVYVSRSEYRNRHHSAFWPTQLKKQNLNTENCCIIPEGASGRQSLKGTSTLLQSVHKIETYNEILLPFASGSTFAGVVISAPSNTQVTGVSVVEKTEEQFKKVSCRLAQSDNLPKYQIDKNYTCGGYAKTTPELFSFMNAWFNNTNIPLEPIYSGKLFFSIYQKACQHAWQPGTKLLAIHTGGLQAIRDQRQLFTKNKHYLLWNKLQTTH